MLLRLLKVLDMLDDHATFLAEMEDGRRGSIDLPRCHETAMAILLVELGEPVFVALENVDVLDESGITQVRSPNPTLN
jgi:hypothetical protein